MTKVAAPVVLLLDGVTQQNTYAQWLRADPDLQGAVIELSVDQIFASPSESIEATQNQLETAAVVIIDEQLYCSHWPQIQRARSDENTVFLVLLETVNVAFVQEILAAGVQDFLEKTHLCSTRLCQTVKLLRQQLQLQIAQTCHQPGVTERQRLEQDLRSSQTQLADALNNSKACITQFRLYPEFSWEYDYYSPGCEVIYGYSPAALKTDGHLWRSRVHPEDLASIIEPLFTRIYAGQTTADIEFRFRHQDGSMRWISESCSARWDEAQDCWVVTVVGVDISDRKRLETQLRDSEAELRGLFEAMDDVVLVLDRQGTYLKVAPSGSNQLYTTASDLVGQTVANLFPPEQADRFLNHIHQVLETQQTQVIEYSLAIAGTEHWFSAKCSPIAADQVIWVARDISDRKRNDIERQQYEVAIAHNATKFRSLIENASEITYTRRLDGTLIYVSPQVEAILGYSPQTLIEQNIWHGLVHPDDVAPAHAAVQRLLTTDQPQREFEVRLRHQDGHWHWMRSNITGAFDDAGTIVSIQGMVSDIHEQKMAEQALYESQARFEAIYEQAAVGICLTASTSGQVLSANQWFCDFLGYSEAELQQMSYADYSHPEEMEMDHALMQGLLAGDIPNFTIEKRLFHKSGELQWATITVSLVRDHTGEPLYGLAIVQDINQQKQFDAKRRLAELKLQENRDFLQTVLDNLPVSLFVKDARPETFGQFVLINDVCEHYLGRTRDDIIGNTDRDLFPIAEANRFMATDQEVITNRAKQQLEEVVDLPHLGHRTLQTTKVPLFDAANRPKYILGISQDVTEITTAQQALKISERKHRALISALPDLIIRMSGDGVYLDMYAASNMVVLNGEDLIGRNIYDQGLPYDLGDRRMGYIRRALETGELQVYEQSIFNGQCDVVEEVRILPSGDNEVIIIVRDISDRKHAELALQASERRYATLTENSPIGIFRFDAAGQCVYVNPRWCAMTGRTLETAGGDNWRELLYPDDRDRMLAGWAEAWAQQLPYRNEGRYIHADGTVVWSDLQMLPEFNETGELLGYIGTVSDISDRKAAEAALQESETRFRQLAETVHEGFFVFETATQQYSYVNPACETITGIDFSQNHSAMWLDRVHPDDRDRVTAAFHRELEAQNFDEEYRFINADDEVRWLRSRAYPIQDDSGTVIRIVGTVEDISDRKAAENSLQASEERLRTAMAAAQMGSWNWHLEPQKVVWSESLERLMGMEPGTFDGRLKTVTAMLHPEDRQHVADAITRSIEQGETYDVEFRFIKPDGTVRWAAGKGDVVRDAEGQVLGMAGVDIDITDRKLAEIQVQEVTQRLQLATDSAEIGIWDYTVSEQRLIWDDHMYWLYGLPAGAAETSYSTWEDNLHPDDRDRAAAELQAAIRGEKGFHTEFRVLWPDGQVRFIEAHAMVWRDTDGTALRMIGVNWDITDRKQAELALQASERRYATLAESSPNAVYRLDAEGNCVYVNPRWCEMTGRTVEQGYGDDWIEVLHPDDRDFLLADLQVAIAEQKYLRNEGRHLLPDGSVIWFDAQIVPERDDNGQFLGFIGTLADITDRKQAELALQQLNEELEQRVQDRTAALARSERDLRTIFNNVYDAIFVHDLDGTILDVNDRALAMSHASREQLIGASVADLSAPSAPMETIQARLQRVRAGESIVFEWKNRHFDDNTSFDTEVTLRQAQLKNRRVLLAGVRDISDRKRIEAKLADSEAKFRRLVEGASDLIWSVDNTGQFNYLSPQFRTLFGWHPDEWLGRSCNLLVHPDDAAFVGEALQDLICTRQILGQIEFRHLHQQGHYIWVRSSGTAICDAEGNFLGIQGILSDISDRKQAEIAIRDSESRFRATFEQAAVGMIRADLQGHLIEFNQKLCDILGYSSAVLRSQHFSELTHPDDIAADQALVNSLLAGEADNFVMEKRYLHQAGHVVWANLSVSLVRTIEGRPQYFIAVVQDISDRKQAEINLQESRNMLELVLNAIPQRVFWKDRNSRFLGCNPAFANDYQLSYAEIMGKTDAELPWADWAEPYREDDIRVIETGASRVNYEEPTTNLNGEHIWIRTSKVPLTNSQGEIIGVLGCYDDISDRKRAEQQLEAERLRLQVALEAAHMGTWESDLETGFWSERTEAIFGYAPGTFPGDREAFVRSIHPDDRDQVFTALTESFAHQTPYNQEYRIHRRDGELRWVAANGKVVAKDDGSGLRIVGVAQDITERKQAEAALRDSEERLRLALNAAKQGLYDLDLRTGDAIVSANYATMLGYNPVNFRETNAKWLQRLHPDDYERVLAVFQAYVAGDIPEYKVEFRQRMKNGEWKWILSVGKSVAHDEMGQPIRLLGTHTDIDERKRAEAALQESETRFRQIAENIKEVFWLATPEFEILYASPAYEQVWGRSPDEVTAETFLTTIYPKDRIRLESRPDLINRRYSSGLLSGESEIEYRIVRPDGSLRWIRDRAFPVLDNQGHIHRIAGIAEDITERKRLEQEQARLLSILEAAPDHIGIATPDGTVIWNNRQAKLIRGLPLDADVTQIPIAAYHPQWALDIIQQVGIPTAMQNDIWIGETALLTADETEILVSQLILAHRGPSGDIDYISTVIRDISALKQAEQTLRQANAELEARVVERTAELVEAKETAEAANRAKSTFLANMSHELRTPLNAILGFSQLMGRDQSLSIKHLEELKIINRSGEHLLALINDILEMTKIEAGHITLSPTDCALLQLLNSLADMLRLKAEAKGLDFTVNCHPQLPQFVRTDSHKLRQVLLNLLSNAIKFTEVGYVTLRVAPGTSQRRESAATKASDQIGLVVTTLRFEVEDSGSGIAPDELDLLFEPFVQTASGRQSQEGTGLGLPISRQFVQLMGGVLDVTSAPGCGSTFTFEIPVQVIETEAIEPETPQRAIAIAPDQLTYRILVVEDNWANRVLLQYLLTDLGFEVQTAVNGQTAIHLWQTWHPHLIFMDIRMPEMNGADATQAIRRLQQSATHPAVTAQPTKIISLTAGVLEDNQSKLAAIGFDDFIRKPIQEGDITDALAQHLGVRFVYESDIIHQTSAAPAKHQFLTIDLLQALSTDWLQQFQTAIMQLNQKAMLDLIAGLRAEHQDLANLMANKIYEFDYELLLDLTQAALER